MTKKRDNMRKTLPLHGADLPSNSHSMALGLRALSDLAGLIGVNHQRKSNNVESDLTLKKKHQVPSYRHPYR